MKTSSSRGETSVPTGLGRPLRTSDIFFAHLEALGIDRIFGNPGTTELPFVDGCLDYPSIEYVLSLHEDIAVAQAMGYARAAGKPGVVNLHVTPGLGHGLSNIFNASRGRVPLLITVGQQHSELVVQEPLLATDLARLAEPFTKWSYDVTMPGEVAVAVQRAFKEVLTAPYGPVLLSLPMDLLFQEVAWTGPPKVSTVSRPRVGADDLVRAAEILVAGDRPVMVVGDGVGQADAWSEAVRLAELLGAEVYSESWTTSWPFPVDHPQYCGVLSNVTGQMRGQLEHASPLIWLGVYTPAPVSRFDGDGPLLPWGAPTVAVDDSARELGKNHPVDVGLLGDVKATLGRLGEAVAELSYDRSAVTRRCVELADASAKRRWKHAVEIEGAAARPELTPEFVAQRLAEAVPRDFVMVDESISNRQVFTATLPFREPRAYLSANGGSLGYAVGLATGLHHGGETRQIITVVGDGSLMYYPQALWGLARADAPVIVIVLNNHGYRVLKLIVSRMGGPWNAQGDPTPGLDLLGPTVDIAGLAKAFGVDSARADTPASFDAALSTALGSRRPFVIEAMVDQPVGPPASSPPQLNEESDSGGA
jgi:benzoylformate decarboxylase